MAIKEFDWTVLLGLMVLGYLIAKLPLFNKVNNEWIEIILLVLGAVIYFVYYDYNILKLVGGAIIGITASGSYNLLNNLPTVIKNTVDKFLGVNND